ncbi:RNA-guided endonuclease InsQ/TnpB family protein [Clostridium tagluense]|uniref:Cas12f1-like TNB domain-containing protein n=1 Tax=Clostridium tagluense TaxID=360422 RepID=A0A401UQB2_9CLOT|nr:RNA-guided endonuclease TnpB family protein [Clostridium tagluense]GCD11717.1 hypothetical protein Ctaglu_33400 [Clostridium tagluense]
MNKCIKVILNKCINIDIKEAKKIIKNMSYLSCKASNKAIDMWKQHSLNIMELKSNDKNFNQKEYEQATYGKNYKNVIEGYMKEIMNICNTSNVSTLHQQQVQNDWKRLRKDVLNYRANLPTYKLDTPCYLKNNNYKLRNHNGYFVDISLFSMKGLEQIGQKKGYQLQFEIDKMDGNKKSTINKLINNGYKQGSAQLKISDKGKIELIMSFSFEAKESNLDENRILGIDLGIVNVATMAIWDGNTQEWDWVNYKHNILNGQELIRFRQKLFNMGMSEFEMQNEVYKQNQKIHQKQLNKHNIGAIDGLELVKYRDTIDKKKREMSIASKWVGEGRVGHGYKNRMKPLEKIRNKASNFADTFNHKYSKYIVEFAIRGNCGVIQMEDLSGATKNTHGKFLKDWSYYDLQTKIEYKAREVGIDVIYVKPQYTSKRCSKCGNIHTDNRDCKTNQAKFKCMNVTCGHEENADINASKNISIPYIDKIIEEYIKENDIYKNKK